MWKGSLEIGSVELAFKLYSAVKTSSELHFRLLHEKDGTPVAQRRIIRDRSANACAVVRRAVQRVNVALSSSLTMSSAFGRPTIRDPLTQSGLNC